MSSTEDAPDPIPSIRPTGHAPHPSQARRRAERALALAMVGVSSVLVSVVLFGLAIR